MNIKKEVMNNEVINEIYIYATILNCIKITKYETKLSSF